MAKYLLRATKKVGEIEVEANTIPGVNLRAREYLVREFDSDPDVHIEIFQIEGDVKRETPLDFKPQNRAGIREGAPFASEDKAPELPSDFHPKNVSKTNPGAPF